MGSLFSDGVGAGLNQCVKVSLDSKDCEQNVQIPIRHLLWGNCLFVVSF